MNLHFLVCIQNTFDWAKEAQLFSYNPESQHGTYQQNISLLKHKLLLKITCPQSFTVDMYKSNMKTDLVVSNVKQRLLFLLDDREQNKDIT